MDKLASLVVFSTFIAAGMGTTFAQSGAPDPALRVAPGHLDDAQTALKAGNSVKAQNALGDAETTLLNSESIKHPADAASGKPFPEPALMAQVNNACVELAQGDTSKARSGAQQAIDTMRAILIQAEHSN